MLKQLLCASLALLGLTGISSCGEDNPGGGTIAPARAKGNFVIAVNSQEDGSEYVLQAEDIEGKTFHIKDNIMEMPAKYYTWLFRGRVALGLSYQQGNPGIGYGLGLNADSTLNKIGEFVVRSRFTNYEFLDDHTFVTTVGGQVSADGKRDDGATFEFWDVSPTGIRLHHRKTIWTSDITGNGQLATFSGLVNMGDGTFLCAMVESAYRERNAENGGSSVGDVSFPDSCWVARLDTALNVKEIYRDGRQSYAAGQYRSMMFRTILKADDGTVYVFSNAYNPKTTRRAGALRIKPGAHGFDPDYHFDIQSKTGGYKFRRVWPLADSKFLLEIYNTFTIDAMSPGHKFAIVDMEAQTLTPLKGLPEAGYILSGSESGGVPMYRKGFIYLPITRAGGDAQIYKVDVATAEATPICTIVGAKEVRSVGYLE